MVACTVPDSPDLECGGEGLIVYLWLLLVKIASLSQAKKKINEIFREIETYVRDTERYLTGVTALEVRTYDLEAVFRIRRYTLYTDPDPGIFSNTDPVPDLAPDPGKKTVFRIRVDPDSNCQAGSVFGIRIRILEVKLNYNNPLFPK